MRKLKISEPSRVQCPPVACYITAHPPPVSWHTNADNFERTTLAQLEQLNVQL